MTIFEAIFILAFIDSTIYPDFFSVPVMLVFFPFAIIVSTVSMVVLTMATRNVFFPIPDIIVSICMNYASVALLLPIIEISVVSRAVWPYQSSVAMVNLASALTRVLSHVLWVNHFMFCNER